MAFQMDEVGQGGCPFQVSNPREYNAIMPFFRFVICNMRFSMCKVVCNI
jgi:hypothetical protein